LKFRNSTKRFYSHRPLFLKHVYLLPKKSIKVHHSLCTFPTTLSPHGIGHINRTYVYHWSPSTNQNDVSSNFLSIEYSGNPPICHKSDERSVQIPPPPVDFEDPFHDILKIAKMHKDPEKSNNALKAALKTLKEDHNISSMTPELYYCFLVASRKTKQYQRAEKIFQQLIQTHGTSYVDCLVEMLLVYTDQNRYTVALDFYKLVAQWLKKKKDLPIAHVQWFHSQAFLLAHETGDFLNLYEYFKKENIIIMFKNCYVHENENSFPNYIQTPDGDVVATTSAPSERRWDRYYVQPHHLQPTYHLLKYFAKTHTHFQPWFKLLETFYPGSALVKTLEYILKELHPSIPASQKEIRRILRAHRSKTIPFESTGVDLPVLHIPLLTYKFLVYLLFQSYGLILDRNILPRVIKADLHGGWISKSTAEKLKRRIGAFKPDSGDDLKLAFKVDNLPEASVHAFKVKLRSRKKYEKFDKDDAEDGMPFPKLIP